MTQLQNPEAGSQKLEVRGMPLVDALRVLQGVRTDEIVITTMGAAREWPKISHHPLDFNYVPSSMGQGPDLGLGLALAQRGQRVIVVNGDGCMLMNLGSLVTITAQSPENYVLIVIDNGVYEVTGGQATAASPKGRADSTGIDWENVARSCGFRQIFHFRELEDWKQQARQALTAPGPVFVWLECVPVTEDVAVRAPGPMRERLSRLRQSLGSL